MRVNGRFRQSTARWLLLLSLLFLAACAQEQEAPEPIVFAPTATLPPTPTLASGAAASLLAPTPQVTPQTGNSVGSVGETAVSATTAAATPSGPATPTPPPAARLQLGEDALQVADYAAAAEQFAASLAQTDRLTPAQRH